MSDQAGAIVNAEVPVLVITGVDGFGQDDHAGRRRESPGLIMTLLSLNMSLTWEVFLSPSIPAIAPDAPPGETARPWPPISSTLISWERDAVLVDTPITFEQSTSSQDQT